MAVIDASVYVSLINASNANGEQPSLSLAHLEAITRSGHPGREGFCT